MTNEEQLRREMEDLLAKMEAEGDSPPVSTEMEHWARTTLAATKVQLSNVGPADVTTPAGASDVDADASAVASNVPTKLAPTKLASDVPTDIEQPSMASEVLGDASVEKPVIAAPPAAEDVQPPLAEEIPTALPVGEVVGRVPDPPERTSKKKRDIDYGKLFGGQGHAAQQVGSSFGVAGIGKSGNILSTVGDVGDIASSLSGSFGGVEAGARGEVEPPLASMLPEMASPALQSGESQKIESRGELNSLLAELIDVLKKHIDVMEQQHRKPGMQEDGTFVPSFSPGSSGGNMASMLSEALGIVPGETQLMQTMMRMLAMSAGGA